MRHSRRSRLDLVTINGEVFLPSVSTDLLPELFQTHQGERGDSNPIEILARGSFFSRIFKHPRAKTVLAYKRVIVPREEPSTEIDRVYIVVRRHGRFVSLFFGETATDAGHVASAVATRCAKFGTGRAPSIPPRRNLRGV